MSVWLLASMLLTDSIDWRSLLVLPVYGGLQKLGFERHLDPRRAVELQVGNTTS